jgi:Bacterial dnaA protein helix-turn-helix
MSEYVLPSTGLARNRIALARIDAVVCTRLGPARVRGNAQPAAFHRQVAMYLAHRVGGWSTTKIGRFYNGRDHSTVCHAIKRIQALRNSNADVEGLVSSLIQELTTRQGIRSRPTFGDGQARCLPSARHDLDKRNAG